MEFICDIDNRMVSVYGKNISDECYDLTVHYAVDIDARSWGIKDINIYVDIITGTLEVSYDDGETYKEVDLSNFEVKVEYDSIGDSVCPQDVTIDIDDKTIEVAF
jgi:hypothetical protein